MSAGEFRLDQHAARIHAALVAADWEHLKETGADDAVPDDTLAFIALQSARAFARQLERLDPLTLEKKNVGLPLDDRYDAAGDGDG